jgi:hypothetical protein
MDLAVSGRQGSQVALLRGTGPGSGNGTFLAATFHNTDFGAAAITAGYFNNDANLDIATVNGYSNTLSILMETATARLSRRRTITGWRTGSSWPPVTSTATARPISPSSTRTRTMF